MHVCVYYLYIQICFIYIWSELHSKYDVYRIYVRHDDVIKWRHFPRYWPFVRGVHRSPVNFPHAQRPVTRSFDVFFDLRPNKRLSEQSWGWWFDMLSCSLWRHRNESHSYVDRDDGLAYSNKNKKPSGGTDILYILTGHKLLGHILKWCLNYSFY